MKHRDVYMLTERSSGAVDMEKVLAYAAGSKLAGTAVGGKCIAAMGGGITLATIVVMVMTNFKNRKEIFVALLSTVISSAFVGAGIITYFGLQDLTHDFFGIVVLSGILFTSGLPGWVLIRAFFIFADKVKKMPIDKLIELLRKITGK